MLAQLVCVIGGYREVGSYAPFFHQSESDDRRLERRVQLSKLVIGYTLTSIDCCVACCAEFIN